MKFGARKWSFVHGNEVWYAEMKLGNISWSKHAVQYMGGRNPWASLKVLCMPSSLQNVSKPTQHWANSTYLATQLNHCFICIPCCNHVECTKFQRDLFPVCAALLSCFTDDLPALIGFCSIDWDHTPPSQCKTFHQYRQQSPHCCQLDADSCSNKKTIFG